MLASSNAIYLDASVLPKIEIEEDPKSVARILIFGSLIPIFCSRVGFGEFIAVMGRRPTQARIGTAGYLYVCRALLKDFEIGKLRWAEPVPDKPPFIRLAEELLSRHSSLGGGDLWHMMSTLQLNSTNPPATLFSFDRDLVKAATSEGLRAVDGNAVDPGALVRAMTAQGKWMAAHP